MISELDLPDKLPRKKGTSFPPNTGRKVQKTVLYVGKPREIVFFAASKFKLKYQTSVFWGKLYFIY